MTIRQALKKAAATLHEAQVPDAKTDAALLLAHVTGLGRMQLPLLGDEPLSSQQEQQFLSLLLLRASRQPLQYLLGQQYFYGLPFQVNPQVLIPRPETETLCQLAIAFLQTKASPSVLDLCTGSGAIAVTLAHECPGAALTAADLSPQALAVAQRNAQANQVSVRFLQGDLFAPLGGQVFDCIVSNPPYIQRAACPALQAEVLFEPLMALDGGVDGLDFYRRIAREAHAHLAPGGFLALEIGDTPGEAVMGLLAAENRYHAIALHNDLSGSPRVVTASAASQPT